MSRIFLRYHHFDECNIEEYGVGAGIVPIAINPKGEPVVLLGRERFLPHWRGSCKWSGFEGSRKTGENMVDTAIREFTEESMGVIVDECDIKRTLHNKEYWKRVVLNIENDNFDQRMKRFHSTYVVVVKWDSNIAERFQSVRSRIEHIECTIQEMNYTRPSVFKNDSLIGTVEFNSDDTATVQTVTCATNTGVTSDECNTLVVTDKEVITKIKTWNSVRERLERTIQQAHPITCIHVERDSLWKCIQHVTVCKDYLEKDQIRWWTLHELTTVLNSRGHTGTHRFRPYFIPVLQVIVEQLKLATGALAEFGLSLEAKQHEAPTPMALALPQNCRECDDACS